MKKILIVSFCCLCLSLFAYEETGMASWYGGKYHGRTTANGEIFDEKKMTAAHKTLPFNTDITVINLANNKSVKVRINDRGPFVEGRIIDLSQAAAEALGVVDKGTAEVRIVVDDPEQLKIFYTIQVGAYGNLENAGAVKKKLIAGGFTPKARLNNKGITRILLENIPEEETFLYTVRLEELGIDKVVIIQNT